MKFPDKSFNLRFIAGGFCSHGTEPRESRESRDRAPPRTRVVREDPEPEPVKPKKMLGGQGLDAREASKQAESSITLGCLGGK